jgi:hypothetical protein
MSSRGLLLRAATITSIGAFALAAPAESSAAAFDSCVICHTGTCSDTGIGAECMAACNQIHVGYCFGPGPCGGGMVYVMCGYY